MLDMNNYPKFWYPILHKSEISKKPKKLELFGRNFVVWQSDDKIMVMDNRCPHRGAELSAGKVCNGAIVCPFHGLEFDTTGKCRFAPEVERDIPKMKVRSYPNKIVADMLWVNFFGEEIDSSYAFGFAQKEFDYFNGKYSMISDVWQNNIRHCIENQLDYTHLATVHKKTIGRGYSFPQTVDVVANDDCIEAIKDDKLMLKYVFPNIWLLNISDSMKITAYFVPISEEKTKVYIINYRKFATSPIIKPIIDMVFRITNKMVLNEDKRVVKTQKFDDAYNKEDFLLKNDQIIKEFRKVWK